MPDLIRGGGECRGMSHSLNGESVPVLIRFLWDISQWRTMGIVVIYVTTLLSLLIFLRYSSAAISVREAG